MGALNYALKIAKKVCGKNDWIYDEDGISTILEMDLEEAGISHNAKLTTPTMLDIKGVVSKWEDETLANYNEEMRTGNWS